MSKLYDRGRSAAQDCCCYRNLLLREVGRGSSAQVYQLFYSDRIPIPLVLKACSKFEDCDAEFEILNSLQHENIIKCVGRPGFVGNKRFILLEMMEKGSLRSRYQSRKLEEGEIKLFMWQLLNALEYLHGLNIVHGDIKCANCLVGKTNNLKLADFGRAAKLKGDRVTRGAIPSVDWAAPEVFEPGYVYGKAAEIYSVGCTMLEMFLGSHPFPEQNGTKYDCCGKIPIVPAAPIIPESARRLINRCLSGDPENRPTVAQLRVDEYFQGVQENHPLRSLRNDEQSSGVLVFGTILVPPFIEGLPDRTPDARHLPTCCMKRAWEWRDQAYVRTNAKLESVQEIFGRPHASRPHASRVCKSPCSFLNLARPDDGDAHLENGVGE